MVTLRYAVPDDAPRIVEMAGLLCLHEGKPLPDLTVEDFLRDGFGSHPPFVTLVAEKDNELIGYAAYYWGYDLETARTGVHIADLFVLPAERGKGVGHLLVSAVAETCRNEGGNWVQWFCQKTNNLALDFYAKLGASLEDDAVSFCLEGAPLDALVGWTER